MTTSTGRNTRARSTEPATGARRGADRGEDRGPGEPPRIVSVPAATSSLGDEAIERGSVGARRSRRLLTLRDTARAMSQENVEVVRANFEAWNAGNMDAVRELHHPDVIVRAPEGWPEPGPFVGREAVMRQWNQLRQTWDLDTVELLSDFIDAGDRVAVRVSWRGAARGPDANLEMTDVFALREGRICDLWCFWDHADALEAVQLSE
jgi:ketosteroid isomerase-like protein